MEAEGEGGTGVAEEAAYLTKVQSLVQYNISHQHVSFIIHLHEQKIREGGRGEA